VPACVPGGGVPPGMAGGRPERVQMLVDLTDASPRRAYHTMIQTIVPRPIAWVLSDNGDGGYNLAPFSYFNGVSSDPPLLMISVGRKADGSPKDTWRNIDERSHFVVHVANRELLQPIVDSSAPLPHGESELDMLGMATTPVAPFRLPRLVGPCVAMFCQRFAIHAIGDPGQGLILGRIQAVWLDDSIATEHDGRLTVDATKLDPLARLGGNDYALFGSIQSAKPTT